MEIFVGWALENWASQELERRIKRMTSFGFRRRLDIIIDCRSWGRGSGLGASGFRGKSNLGKRDWS